MMNEPSFNYKEDLVLTEALRVVSGPRRRDYDDPLPNHQRIANVWNVQVGRKLKTELSARDVGMMMIGLKLARDAFSPKPDNLVDIIGYAQCVQYIDHPGLVARSAGLLNKFMGKFLPALRGGDRA